MTDTTPRGSTDFHSSTPWLQIKHGILLLNDPSELPLTFRIKSKLLKPGLPGAVCPTDFRPLRSYLPLVSPSVWPHKPSFCSLNAPNAPTSYLLFPYLEHRGHLILTPQVHLQCHLRVSLTTPAIHFLLNHFGCARDTIISNPTLHGACQSPLLVSGYFADQGNVYGLRTGVCRFVCSLP